MKNCFPGCSFDIKVRQFKGIFNVNDLTNFKFIVLSHRDIGIFCQMDRHSIYSIELRKRKTCFCLILRSRFFFLFSIIQTNRKHLLGLRGVECKCNFLNVNSCWCCCCSNQFSVPCTGCAFFFPWPSREHFTALGFEDRKSVV